MGSNMGSEEAKMTTVEVLTWIDVATYTFLLVFVVRNTVKYLVM